MRAFKTIQEPVIQEGIQSNFGSWPIVGVIAEGGGTRTIATSYSLETDDTYLDEREYTAYDGYELPVEITHVIGVKQGDWAPLIDVESQEIVDIVHGDGDKRYLGSGVPLSHYGID